jgi:exodeoxyribonuclease X
MADWADKCYVVVDVEGNGQQPPDIVEVAAVPILNGVIGTPQSWLVRPPRPVTQMTVRIHGLTNPELADAPVFADIEKELRLALDADVLVAHNAHGDVAVLQRHLGEWDCPEIVDTLRLARRLLPRQASYKLGALVDALHLEDGLPPGLVPHRATYDALVAARLFVRLAALDVPTLF